MSPKKIEDRFAMTGEQTVTHKQAPLDTENMIRTLTTQVYLAHVGARLDSTPAECAAIAVEILKAAKAEEIKLKG